MMQDYFSGHAVSVFLRFHPGLDPESMSVRGIALAMIASKSVLAASVPNKCPRSTPSRESQKAEKTAPVVKPDPAVVDTAKKGFAVQLGVFADADNARQTIAKMKEAKLPVFSDSVPIKSGTATRIRVGPFATREKADSALAEVKLAGSDGKIIPLQ